MFKRHYDKIIICCCFLFVFANLGMSSTAFSVHQPYLVALEGVGDAGGSMILSARTLASLIGMFFVDRYYQRVGLRRGVVTACLSSAVGFFIYSAASPLPAFMLGAVFCGFGYGMGGAVALTYASNRWFKSGIGGVVGVASMGSGFAAILMPLIVVRIIEASSLSAAFRIEGVIILAIAVVVFALLREKPADLGLEQFERNTGSGREKSSRNMQKAPKREHAYLMAAMVAVGIFCCCCTSYVSVLASSSGFSTMFAAHLVSVAGIALTISKFFAGKIFDRLGAPCATCIIFVIGVLGYVLCCCAGLGVEALMMCGTIAFSVGMTLGTVGLSVWSIDLSNPANRAHEIRNFQVSYSVGGFIANTLPGFVKELTGTYVTSYAVTAAIGVFAALVILRYYRKYRVS